MQRTLMAHVTTAKGGNLFSFGIGEFTWGPIFHKANLMHSSWPVGGIKVQLAVCFHSDVLHS